MTKKCIKCNTTKKLEEFQKNCKIKDGRTTRCKVCLNKQDRERYKTQGRREQKRLWNQTDNGKYSRYITALKKYNLIEQTLRDLQDAQNGCCAICNISLVNPAFDKNDLHIDHCHKTGKVRGLLCKRCNVSLGALEEREDLLSNMIRYIKND